MVFLKNWWSNVVWVNLSVVNMIYVWEIFEQMWFGAEHECVIIKKGMNFIVYFIIYYYYLLLYN